jgi:tRNA threonylcarbamoyladenosine biosynthesis protein TsaB
VALVTPGHCLGEFSLHSRETHSKRLLLGIDWLLREVAVSWEEIDALAISLGPGSFTGLRIGLSTVKGLAMATGKPLIGVPTLDGLATQLAFSPHLICPVLDARKKEIYTAFYRGTASGELQRLGDYLVIPPTTLVGMINEPTILVGDGTLLHGEFLRQQCPELVSIAPAELSFCRAAAIGSLALKKWERGEFLDPATSSPIYVRASDAEIQLKKRTTPVARVEVL